MSKRAVLLVNLGSPDSPNVPDVRRYLQEFLGDERVIDKPAQPFRKILVNGIIIPFRVKKSAHAYSTVWKPEGSPLIITSKAVQRALQKALPEMPVFLAMRYGNPSTASVIAEMISKGVEEVYLIPQYPHYAMSSWETVTALVYAEFARQAPKVKVHCIQPFYQDSDYIEALHSSASPYLAQPHDYLLFSFHGIPVRHLEKADSSHAHCNRVAECCLTPSPAHATCYKAQCLATVRALVKRAGIPPERYGVSFQSRLVGEPWLSPYTDVTLAGLPARGIKRVLVITPAFVADCLETIEEIAEEGKETFMDAGGESFTLIPCMNEHPAYIEFLRKRSEDWTKTPALV